MVVENNVFFSSPSGAEAAAIVPSPWAARIGSITTLDDNYVTGLQRGKFGSALNMPLGRGIWSDGGGVTLNVTGNTFE